jgi:hypothetical protein
MGRRQGAFVLVRLGLARPARLLLAVTADASVPRLLPSPLFFIVPGLTPHGNAFDDFATVMHDSQAFSLEVTGSGLKCCLLAKRANLPGFQKHYSMFSDFSTKPGGEQESSAMHHGGNRTPNSAMFIQKPKPHLRGIVSKTIPRCQPSNNAWKPFPTANS